MIRRVRSHASDLVQEVIRCREIPDVNIHRKINTFYYYNHNEKIESETNDIIFEWYSEICRMGLGKTCKKAILCSFCDDIFADELDWTLLISIYNGLRALDSKQKNIPVHVEHLSRRDRKNILKELEDMFI